MQTCTDIYICTYILTHKSLAHKKHIHSNTHTQTCMDIHTNKLIHRRTSASANMGILLEMNVMKY